MAYVTPNQTVKTVAKFLWQGYILIFRTLAKLLSDQGANFESNIIRELCGLMGIRKVRTLPYHAQANGQVEKAHQILIYMIGKLSKDCRASSSYFFLFFSKIHIFSYFSANLQLNSSFQGIFRFYFFQCGNTCTERAVLWENFSHGVVWVRFSHKSLTNVWRSVDLTSPYPG